MESKPEKPRRIIPPTAVEALRELKEEDAQAGLEKWNDELEHLTQLKSRRTFDRDLGHDFRVLRGEVEEHRTGVKSLEEVVLVMVDLDKFKDVNDTYGHQAGDEVLRKVAEVLLESVRPSDTVARYGGEELVIIMRNIKPEVAAAHANEIRKKIKALIFNGDYSTLKVTASFGVASSKSLTNPTPEALIQEADAKLYEAKNAGRNNVKF